MRDVDWSSRFYHTKVGVDYKHSFNTIDFLLGGEYISKVFNLRESEEFSQKQHQTLIHGYMGFASADKDMPIQFVAEVGIKSFQEKYPVM